MNVLFKDPSGNKNAKLHEKAKGRRKYIGFAFISFAFMRIKKIEKIF
jgi:hypothetical protein